MSRIKRTPSILLLALGALLMVSIAHARPGGRHGPRGGKMLSPKHFDALAEELKIDQKMRESLKAQLEATRAEAKGKKDALREAHHALRSLLDADVPDRAAVMAQIDKIGALKLALHKLKVGAMIDLRAALSPEQRAQLKAKMEARRARRHKRRGKRRGKRGRRGGDEPGFEPPGDDL